MKNRLDRVLYEKGLVQSRSQAENYIKLGLVTVDGRVINKPSLLVSSSQNIQLAGDLYVSRAALKLASVSEKFSLNFLGKTVLDVGSSTGGFTDYALQHGAKKVVAVDVGTDQLHPSLRGDKRIELYEKTDIRGVQLQRTKSQTPIGKTSSKNRIVMIQNSPDIVVIDVSFISLTKVLPHISRLMSHGSVLVAMCKPQFEANKGQINKGVIKNNSIRRQILKDFELWLSENGFVTLNKADSQVAGAKGNLERFYLIRISRNK